MALEAGVRPPGADGLPGGPSVGSIGGAGAVGKVGGAGGTAPLDFGAVMKGALDRVNGMQQNASTMATPENALSDTARLLRPAASAAGSSTSTTCTCSAAMNPI
jgi:hypothetical protein